MSAHEAIRTRSYKMRPAGSGIHPGEPAWDGNQRRPVARGLDTGGDSRDEQHAPDDNADHGASVSERRAWAVSR